MILKRVYTIRIHTYVHTTQQREFGVIGYVYTVSSGRQLSSVFDSNTIDHNDITVVHLFGLGNFFTT